MDETFENTDLESQLLVSEHLHGADKVEVAVNNIGNKAHDVIFPACLEELSWDGLLAANRDLVAANREKDEHLALAGTYGKSLLEELSHSQEQFEVFRKQHEEDLESWIQENHDLKVKLEAKEKFLKLQLAEFDAYRKEVEQDRKTWQDRLEEVSSQSRRDVAQSKREKEFTQSQLDRALLRESQVLEENKQLLIRAEELTVKARTPIISSPSVSEQDLFNAVERQLLLEEERDAVADELKKTKNLNQCLKLELQSLQDRNLTLQQDFEEAEKQSTCYFNHLEVARQELQDAKVELDALKLDLKNQNHLERGNSLFGEVEDRRAEMEKKFKSMEVKYGSLEKAYNYIRSQLQNMKAQCAALLSMTGGRADSQRISSLEQALRQAQGEVLILTKKLAEMEAKKQSFIDTDEVKTLGRKLDNWRSNEDMVEFLCVQVDQMKEKMQRQKRELDQERFIRIAETDKLKGSEEKLYQAQVDASKYKNDAMRLRLALDECKHKLEAETQKRQLVERKFGYDSSKDVVSEGVFSEQESQKSKRPLTLQRAQDQARHKSEELSTKPKIAMKPLPKQLLEKLQTQGATPSTRSVTVVTSTSSLVRRNDAFPRSADPGVQKVGKEGMSNAEFSSVKPRKVSFKPEAEEIPFYQPEEKENLSSDLNCMKTVQATTGDVFRKANLNSVHPLAESDCASDCAKGMQ